MTRGVRCRLVALCLLVAVVPGATARAGGFYLLPRGARGSVQGGAVVAGGDDPGALWTNPAGLAASGRQALFDLVLPVQSVSFRRINAGGMREPTVSSTSEPLPIPGFAVSETFGLRHLTFGVGMLAPASALHRWPRRIRGADGETVGAPQRYSLVGMRGSALATLSAGVAYRPIRRLSLGVAATAVLARFTIDVVMSTCDNAVLCKQPESDRWDADARIMVPGRGRAPVLVRPGGAFGFVLDVAERAGVRLGGSVTLPFELAGVAQLRLDLPDEQVAEFRGARLSNDKVDFALAFPMIVRLGVEVRPLRALRMEVQGTWEDWSVQRELTVKPRGIRIEAPLLDHYDLRPLSLPRGMRDVYALGVGGEYTINPAWQLRVGSMVERGAVPDQYLTILTPDTDKWLFGLGATWAVTPQLSLDVAAGHVFMRNRRVRNSKVYQPYPLSPPPDPDADGRWMPGEAVPLGNGDMRVEASFLGVGARYRFAPW